jgi:methyl-accepting chemotaxis protein
MEVAEAAGETTRDADGTQESAKGLASMSSKLTDLVGQFKYE